MQLDVEFQRSRAKLNAATERRCRAAVERAHRLTPMEWAEVAAGVREHPDAVAERARRAAEEERQRQADRAAESFGAALRGLNDSLKRFAERVNHGYMRGGL